ncbi:MAG: hypothetical protein LBN19_01365 [Endomicrobium sp.]|jgi:uncharacterized protein HemX|nr:hypothetical protein [Endomicrobium sp.]
MKLITNHYNNKFYFETETNKIKRLLFLCVILYYILFCFAGDTKDAERIYPNSVLNNSNSELSSFSKYKGKRETAIITAVIAAVVIIGYFYWHKPKKQNKKVKTKINHFDKQNLNWSHAANKMSDIDKNTSQCRELWNQLSSNRNRFSNNQQKINDKSTSRHEREPNCRK